MRTWGRSKMGHRFTGEAGAGSRGRSRASRGALRGALTVLTLAVLVGCSSSLTDVLGSDLQTAAPTFNLEPGTYEEDISIELASETDGAVIYYTTDGTDPTVSGDQYGGPIEVAGNGAEADIRAYADAEGRQPSATVRGQFEVAYEPLPAPTFTPAGGTTDSPAQFNEAVDVEVSVPEHPDAAIYYNIDGGAATTDDTPYDGAIALDDNGTYTINVVAVKEGYTASQATGVYSLDLGQVAEPSFELADGSEATTGTYGRDLSVSIVTATNNATIYYALADGSSAPQPVPGESGTEEYDGTPIPIAGDGTVKTLRAMATAAGQDDSVIAKETFTIDYPDLTLEAGTGGSVAFADGGGTGPRAVEAGTSVEITATPESGFQFGTWSVTSGDAQTVEFTDATAAATQVTLGAQDVTVTGSFVDEAAPNPPEVSVPSLTNNPRPTWSWTPGGGGNGTFRYKLNDADLSSGATVTNATTFTPGSDLADDNHTLYVQEQDDSGNWSATGSATVTVDTTAPGQPGIEGVSDGFVAESVTFTVDWAEPGGTQEYRLTSGGNWQSYTGDVTISSEGDYQITARQTDVAGNVSQLASSVSGTILTPPSGLTATAQNADRIDLSWQDNSGTEDGYEVQRKEGSGGNYATVMTLSADTTGYQDTGLDPQTTYYYRVRATNSAGASNWSNETNAETLKPAAPSGVTATAQNADRIDLSWQNESVDADTIQLQRGTGDSYTTIDTLQPDATAYSDTGLDSETAYDYRLRAIDSGVSGDWSPVASATTAELAAPSGLTATAVNPTQIDLSWNDNSSFETDLEIERDGTVIDTVGADSTSYTDTGLSSGTQYTYRVRAVDSGGDSPWSINDSATTDYEIGDTGPAGGLIFYDDEDDGTDDYGFRYLEAAPASTEWIGKRWGGYGTDINGDDSTIAPELDGIGDGASNTAAIVAEFGTTEPYEGKSDYAARLADDLEHNGYTDWFLPSKDELDLMYQNLHQQGLGGFAEDLYWSSSEGSSNYAYYQYFSPFSPPTNWKYAEFRVRAARAFGN